MDEMTRTVAKEPPWEPERRPDGSVEIGVNHFDTRSGRLEFQSVSPQRYLELWGKNALKHQLEGTQPGHLPTRAQVVAFLAREKAGPINKAKPTTLAPKHEEPTMQLNPSEVANRIDGLDNDDKKVILEVCKVGGREMSKAAKRLGMSRTTLGKIIKAIFEKLDLGDLSLKDQRASLRSGWAHLHGEPVAETPAQPKTRRSKAAKRGKKNLPVVARNRNGNGRHLATAESFHLGAGVTAFPMPRAALEAIITAGGLLLLGQADKAGVIPGRVVYIDNDK